MRLCIDLCSGLGGFSQAFVDAGWDVVRIDIERKFKPTIQADVKHLPLRTNLRPDELLASPPCNALSLAGVRLHWTTRLHGFPEPISKAAKATVKLVRRLKKEVKRLDPEYGLLENPHPGMMVNLLGRPDHHIRQSDYGSPFKKPTGLWELGRKFHQFAWLEFQGNWITAPRGSKTGIQGTENVRKLEEKIRTNRKHHSGLGDFIRLPELRAYIPYGLSKAILEAIT